MSTAIQTELERCVRELHSTDPSVQAEAAKAIQVLTTSYSHEDAVVRSGALPRLIELMERGTVGVQERAAAVVANLAVVAETARAAAQAVVPLVQLLSRGRLAKEIAAEALANLAANPGEDQRGTITAAGALGPLVDLVKGSSRLAQENAASALQNLAADHPENARNITEAGAVGRGLQGRFLNLAADPDSETAMVRAGAVRPLLKLLTRFPPRPRAQQRAAMLLSCLARQHTLEILKHGNAIKPLVELLNCGNSAVEESAADVLFVLTLHPRGWAEAKGLGMLGRAHESQSPKVRLLVDPMYRKGPGPGKTSELVVLGLGSKNARDQAVKRIPLTAPLRRLAWLLWRLNRLRALRGPRLEKRLSDERALSCVHASMPLRPRAATPWNLNACPADKEISENSEEEPLAPNEDEGPPLPKHLLPPLLPPLPPPNDPPSDQVGKPVKSALKKAVLAVAAVSKVANKPTPNEAAPTATSDFKSKDPGGGSPSLGGQSGKARSVRFQEDAPQVKSDKDEKEKKTETTPQEPDDLTVSNASSREDIMAKTMFDMVSTVTLDNPGLSYRVLFATERQAQIIGNNPDTLEKLAAQFRTEETAKPKVVINLLTSLGTSQLREKRKQHPDEDEQHRLDMFMRHVLLPIAEQTNALVLCDAVADRCILADSFVRMCRVRHAAWNKKMPFTVVGVTTMNELDKRSGERCFWRELMGKCKGAWEDEWKKYYKNRQLNIDKSIPTGTGGVGDIQPLLPNLIIAGGFESSSNSRAAASTLKTALVSHLGASIPSIAFKTGMSELSYLKQTTESGLETAVDAIQQQTAVVFLDLFRRDKLQLESILESIPGTDSVKTPQDLPVRARHFANGGQDCETEFLKGAEAMMLKRNTAVENAKKTSFFDACAIAKLHSRYRRFFGEAKKQQRKFALWQAICLEERNRETRDIDGVRQARSVLYKVFQEHAKEMGVVFAAGWQHSVFNSAGWQNSVFKAAAVLEDEDDEAQAESVAAANEKLQKEHEESATYAFVARSTELVSSEFFTSINIWRGQSALERRIYAILTRSRLPPQHNLEALRLLLDAWTEYDVAKHLATYYGRLSRLWYFSQIVCGLGTVVFSVIAQTFVLEEFYTSLINFTISLFCTTLISLHAFANPTTRWHKLRCAAADLESLTWLFRTKCKQFESSDIDSVSNSVTLFREQLNEWRRNVVRGTDLHRSDFQRKWPHEKLTRGQHEKSRIYSDKHCPVQKPLDDEDMHEDDDVINKSTMHPADGVLPDHSPRRRQVVVTEVFWQRLCCCRKLRPSPPEAAKPSPQAVERAYKQAHGEEWDPRDDHEQNDKSQASDAEAQSRKAEASQASLEAWQDDHHSPVNADEYIRWRLQTMRRFYEQRLPAYAKYHRFIFALTLLGSMGSSIFAYISLNSWVVVAASLSTSASSWMEFSNVLQNIQRYSDTIQELKKLEAWWESLAPMEKASKENLNLLVCIFQKMEAFVFEAAL
ncbi:PUB2 [Symbiodinium sp. KB8]|nr:PUB2 [Symbiodinium sp. KB8]